MIKNHPEYQYLELVKDILQNGVKNVDQGTGAVSYSVFGRQVRFDLNEGFPLLTTKAVYWKGVLEELYWFMSGQTNIKYLVDNKVHIWDDYPYRIYLEKMDKGEVPKMTKDEFIKKIEEDKNFAKEHGELPRIYGEMWRSWPTRHGKTIDQLQWVLDELKNDPDARNLIVNSWNPEYLYTMAKPEDASRFPICHNMYQVSMKDNKINLQLYQRSADVFLGVPFNIASYALLAHIIAKVSGYGVGDFVHTFGDVHIYANHFEQVKEQLSREPNSLPKLKIDSSVKTIDDFRPEHAIIEGYNPHPSIKAKLSPTGGISTKSWENYFKKMDQEKNE